MKQSKQLRRLARRDRFRKPGSPVLPISQDEYQTRIAGATAAAQREREDEGTREFRHRFASAMSLVSEVPA